MRGKDEQMRRKCRDFPHFCAVEVFDDWAAWNGRLLEMEAWCRQRVGADGFAKQGRMGAERNSMEYRFKTPEIAAEFQAAFGGKLGGPEIDMAARAPTATGSDSLLPSASGRAAE
jgi:hypothetical protein